MKKTALALAAVIAASAFAGCEAKVTGDTGSLINKNKAGMTLHGTEYDVENGKKLVYSCEVNDRKISAALRKSIDDRKSGQKYRSGDDFLTDIYVKEQGRDGSTAKSGYVFSEGLYKYEKGKVVEIGDRVVFVSAVPNHSTERFEADKAQQAEFEELIMNYLRENTEPEVYELNTAGDKDKIVFSTIYSNWAEDFQCSGNFIDTYGDLYTFNFDMDIELERDFKIDEALMKFYMENEPIRQCVCDPERLREIQSDDFYRIDQNADDDREMVGCDMGNRSIYVYDRDYNKICLKYVGSDKGELQDETAKELVAFYKNIIS